MDNRYNLGVLKEAAQRFGFKGNVVELWRKEYDCNAECGETDHNVNCEIANGMVLQEIWDVKDNEEEVRDFADDEALDYRF